MNPTIPGTRGNTGAALCAAVLAIAGSATAQLTWSPVAGTVPPARSATGAGMSYFNQNTILFGGLDAVGGVLGDTWRFDGVSWTQMPGLSPAPRSHHAMATRGPYHVMLFGGRDASGAILGDAWLWVSNSQTWVSLPTGPPARECAAATTRPGWDAVMFGGRNGTQVLGDTWFCGEYTSPMWTSPTFAVSPPARHGHAMSYDSSGVVLFGGIDAAGNHRNDTWLLQASSSGPVWVQASPSVSPSPRRGHAMRYDGYRGRAQLFGGEGPGGLLGDTWEWDGSNWLPITTSGSPTPRTDAVLVDSRHAPGPVPIDGLLFGGRDAAGPLAQPWLQTSTLPAAVSFFGSGPLTCGVNAYPWLGGSFTVSTHFVGAGTPLIPHLIAGFSNTTSPLGPLPLGLGAMFDNATLRVDPVILLAMVPASPTTHATTLSLPAVPGLAGMHLYLQVIAYLPTSPPAWGTSAGIDCTLGWL